NELLEGLQRLDRILEPAVDRARAVFGPDAVADPFKGLHISPLDARDLLARQPGAPLLWTPAAAPPSDERSPQSPLSWLAGAFSLSAFEIDVVLLALACEIDLRYERVFAFLQNDVTRRRPGVELALDLLCASAPEKIARQTCFSPDAPLVCKGLLE